ncbi:MAG TPA: hypothetical protein VFX65_06425 [Candidatus Limnocylindrales bacterium]|nr:hypothetical protein [Candidatus Limnocylindrales bacterium]
MTTRSHGPNAGSSHRHATHDRILIAARAAGDLEGRDLDRAEALLAECGDCRLLHAELRAIAGSTRDLPPAVRPPTLDFRIAPGRATELRRGAGLRRLLGPFGRSGDRTVRPLALTFSTLGVAGLLLAALPMLPFGGGALFIAATGASPDTREVQVATMDPGAMPPEDLATGDTAGGIDTSGGEPTSPIKNDNGSGDPGAPVDEGGGGGGEAAGPGAGTSGDGDLRAGGGPTPLVLLSVGFLGAGIGLYLLRRVALRLR